MMRPAMSVAAAGLLRALLARAGVERHRILLTHFRSTDWRSLTFEGERHEVELRITGGDSESLAARLVDGLAEAEFAIPGQIVADISVRRGPVACADGTALAIEALTIAE